MGDRWKGQSEVIVDLLLAPDTEALAYLVPFRPGLRSLQLIVLKRFYQVATLRELDTSGAQGGSKYAGGAGKFSREVGLLDRKTRKRRIGDGNSAVLSEPTHAAKTGKGTGKDGLSTIIARGGTPSGGLLSEAARKWLFSLRQGPFLHHRLPPLHLLSV